MEYMCFRDVIEGKEEIKFAPSSSRRWVSRPREKPVTLSWGHLVVSLKGKSFVPTPGPVEKAPSGKFFTHFSLSSLSLSLSLFLSLPLCTWHLSHSQLKRKSDFTNCPLKGEKKLTKASIEFYQSIVASLPRSCFLYSLSLLSLAVDAWYTHVYPFTRVASDHQLLYLLVDWLSCRCCPSSFPLPLSRSLPLSFFLHPHQARWSDWLIDQAFSCLWPHVPTTLSLPLPLSLSLALLSWPDSHGEYRVAYSTRFQLNLQLLPFVSFSS